MKKVLLSFALMMGVCLFANAQEVVQTVDAQTLEVELAAAQDEGFKTVEKSALPEVVQTAIDNLSGTVKEIAYNSDTNQTKVTLVAEDNSETIVILDEEGTEVK